MSSVIFRKIIIRSINDLNHDLKNVYKKKSQFYQDNIGAQGIFSQSLTSAFFQCSKYGKCFKYNYRDHVIILSCVEFTRLRAFHNY